MFTRLLTTFTRILFPKLLNPSSVVFILNWQNFLSLNACPVKHLLTSLDLLHSITHPFLQSDQLLCHPNSRPAEQSVSLTSPLSFRLDVLYQFHAIPPTKSTSVRAPPTFLPWHIKMNFANCGRHSFHRQGIFIQYRLVSEFRALQALVQAGVQQNTSDTLNDALISTPPMRTPPVFFLTILTLQLF